MRCSPTSCSAFARIWGDDELERHALSVLRLVRDRSQGSDRVRVIYSLRLTSTSLRTVSCDRRLPADDVAEPPGPRERHRRGRLRPADEVPLLAAGTRVGRPATLYVCHNFACELPMDTPPGSISSNVMALLEIRDLTRRFGGIVAIDDVSLTSTRQIVG